MTSNLIIDRKLPERANLKFYFPNTMEGKPYLVVSLPFFENPSIKESKKARFKKYSLISRSSNLYSYLGADSRQLNLSFNITLPHILHEHRDITKDVYKSSAWLENPEVEKELFASPVATPPYSNNATVTIVNRLFKGIEGLKDSAQQVLSSPWAQRGMTFLEFDYINRTYGLTKTSPKIKKALANENISNSETGSQIYTDLNNPSEDERNDDANFFDELELLNESSEVRRLKVIDILIYWINIIRASVVNNAQNPLYGPPVIRLRHGIMYQDVPCICTGYNIDFEERAGYDLQTLLPRRLKIDMKLEEFRTGNFGTFDQTQVISRDNVAGWEAVLAGPQTMDPGYYPQRLG
jgi:hypothetical protein